jgi:GTP1/Obg family GTP-binding protein
MRRLCELLGSCYWVPSSERQKQSRENLEHQKAFLAYERKQLEGQIEECERRKVTCMQSKRVRDAKDAVRDKHRFMKKLDKTRELYDFTDNLLEQILNATTMRQTLSTINEAQQTFMRINPSTIYSRYAKMSEKFSVFQEQMTDTQEQVNSSLSGLSVTVDDAELLAELESLAGKTITTKPKATVTKTTAKCSASAEDADATGAA